MSYLKVIEMRNRFPESTARWMALDAIAAECQMYEDKIALLIDEAMYYASGTEQDSVEFFDNMNSIDIEV